MSVNCATDLPIIYGRMHGITPRPPPKKKRENELLCICLYQDLKCNLSVLENL